MGNLTIPSINTDYQISDAITLLASMGIVYLFTYSTGFIPMIVTAILMVVTQIFANVIRN